MKAVHAEDDDDIDRPLTPGIDTVPTDFDLRDVEYSTRGPRDVVLSGPVIGGSGPGRYFQNRRLAYLWARGKYGPERVRRTERECKWRWSFLIKDLKAEPSKEAA